jgi:hypothetical protein
MMALDTIMVTSTGGSSSGNGGGGGAGAEANGTTNNGTTVAQSFRNYLNGNLGNQSVGFADGGFGGGGGGGGNGGGGGGGWRGGNSTNDAGQGGTSYINAMATNTSSSAGINSGYGYVTIQPLYSTQSYYVPFSTNATNNNKLYTDSGITYNIDSNTLNSNNITYNTLQQTSDMKLKENIKDYKIENSIDIVNNLKLKEYNYIDDDNKKKIIGYIAQDVEEIFPEAVESNDKKTLNPYYLTLLHGEAIKELDKMIHTDLENNINIIETNNKKISELEKKYNNI